MVKCAKKGCKQEAVEDEPYCEIHRNEGISMPGYMRGGTQPYPPIVISGGSVTIEFDGNVFQQLGRGRHGNFDKKIRRVEIRGDGINISQDTPDGRVVILIHYGDP